MLRRGSGAYVETTDGNSLLDVMLGGWLLILGHYPTIVSEAVTSQIELGVNLGHISQPVIDLARLFVGMVPCAEKVRFVNSGSEAIHLAARIVRAYRGKEKILKFEGAYHGNTDTLLFNTNYGAITGSEELMNLLDPSIVDVLPIFSTGSYHANALSATAALATLRELEKPGTFDRLNAYGNSLREGLFEVFKSNDIDAQMTGVGSIVEFFFTREAIVDYRSASRSDLRLKQLLGRYLPHHGVLGGAGMYVSSTRHGDTELSLMLDGVRASLREIRKTEGF
jgi:glutamate-1-semialdehyde aminotransferase